MPKPAPRPAAPAPGRIPITKVWFDERERRAVVEPLETGWLVQGPKVAAFEKAIAGRVGVPYARATTSCTTALHLGLLALGVRPGDRVFLPSFTYVATANAVEYVGAVPVLVDVDLETFNVDPEKMETAARKTRRATAVLPVHLFGLVADMKAIGVIARARRLRVLEDAACAVGSALEGRSAGAWGDAGAFSFHPRKLITTGEGGMVTTADPEVAAEVESLRNHGAAVSDLTRHLKGGSLLGEFDRLGYNYRMTDLQAALGLAQFEKLDRILEFRRARAARYDRMLSKLDWLATPSVPAGAFHSYQSYVVRLRMPLAKGAPVRNRIMADLEARGISVRQGTHAVHLLGYYRRKYGYSPKDFPASTAADRLSISLPLFPQMTDEEQDRVVEALGDAGP